MIESGIPPRSLPGWLAGWDTLVSTGGIGRRQGIQLGHSDLEILMRGPSGDGDVGLGVAGMEM